MPINIARRLAIIALALVPLLAGRASATEEKRTDSPEQIHRAVFADGRLWLLAGGGRLSHIAESGERTDVATPDPVMELFVQDGHAAIVTCPKEAFGRGTPVERWTVRRRVGDDWETVADIATRGETFVAATSSIVLTDSRMIELTGSSAAETALTLSQPARPKPAKAEERFTLGAWVQFTDDDVIDLTEGVPWQAAPAAPPSPTPLKRWQARAVLVTPQHVYVGTDAGEWGGGLRRIDRMTGIVSDIEDVDGDLCGGNLNPACDPVKGIATIPWKPDCVAVAIGLIHMATHGRIAEVCDTSVRQLYAHVIRAPTYQTPDGRTETYWFAQTTAFFGLQRRDGDLLAVGHDGLYQIGDGDRAQQIPFPAFTPAGNLAVSFDLPGVVLLLISGTQGPPSQNNGALMLVPR
ncbi:hypothetical protein SSBR45G_17130 [Bradyrhizobium sp. SSBR45G]|uniref:hypothetical protein n=1 Tax=unclassified Bradyrhizobium TaxID=2631580 RepID=UPI0023429A8C|nr:MULTISPECIES: hypothetical protein [unclassified Bradyrhizobium]GLH76805.1 hypothetical protein SSBR45G_17130 [Bradyrhizobium sp. SSBR45G]GLH83563.1 hypothetical protein SSBR45R_10230 [Bradyrhizobium sp. SSBR45R]